MPAAFLICEARARFGNRSHSEGRFFCMIGNGNSVLELWAGGCVKPLFFLLFFFLAAMPVKPSWPALGGRDFRSYIGVFFFSFRFTIF